MLGVYDNMHFILDFNENLCKISKTLTTSNKLGRLGTFFYTVVPQVRSILEP